MGDERDDLEGRDDLEAQDEGAARGPLVLGSLVGQYRLARELGHGGMGVVYEAIHDEIGRRAAVKVLSARCADDPRYLSRFLNEARAISRVRHPGLVQIYDFGQTAAGAPYILMELLEGETLRQRLVRRTAEGAPLTAQEVRRLARQIATTLAATHDELIVHRDLKPENAMLVADDEAPGGERVKLLDFGIARFVDSPDATLTAPGMAVGTVAYMSPEQCAGDSEIGGGADVYALGVMLHELLTGARPFEAPTALAVMRLHLTGAPKPLPAAVSPELARLISLMLAKEPTLRPTMRAVAAALVEPAAGAGGFDGSGKPGVDLDETEELRRGAPVAAASAAAVSSTPATAPSPTAAPLAPSPASPSTPASAPARSRRRLNLTLAVLLLVSFAAYPAYRLHRGRSARSPSTAPAKIVDMAWFPGGAFRMGRTAEEIEHECEQLGRLCLRSMLDREQPAHRVELSPFYLDRREATNEEVASWLNSLRTSLELRKDEERGELRWAYLDGVRLVDLLPPGAGIVREADGSFRARPADAHRPAVQITWDGAALYCKSRGKRLPTEAEWERAARGTSARRFPWGDDVPRCGQVAWGRDEGKPCAAEATAPATGALVVGTAALDRTPEGVFDLGGNVMEWVQDQFLQPYYKPCGTCVDPVSKDSVPLEEDMRVVRGGSWAQSWHMGRATMRGRWKRVEVLVNAGMRCASS